MRWSCKPNDGGQLHSESHPYSCSPIISCSCRPLQLHHARPCPTAVAPLQRLPRLFCAQPPVGDPRRTANGYPAYAKLACGGPGSAEGFLYVLVGTGWAGKFNLKWAASGSWTPDKTTCAAWCTACSTHTHPRSTHTPSQQYSQHTLPRSTHYLAAAASRAVESASCQLSLGQLLKRFVWRIGALSVPVRYPAGPGPLPAAPLPTGVAAARWHCSAGSQEPWVVQVRDQRDDDKLGRLDGVDHLCSAAPSSQEPWVVQVTNQRDVI